MKKKLKFGNKLIPVSSPYLIHDDIKRVIKSLKEGWISSNGPYLEEFENKFSKFVGKKYSILVSNCTAALEISIRSLDLKKKSEVIIPNFTIISNALAVHRNNLKIVPVDCDIDTWNVNPSEIEKNITKKTKAVIATHIYNYPLEIDKIKTICKKYNLFLIEDAAEVLGLKYKNKQCGSFGDISVFSFYANKQITMGEGGIICTNDKKIFEKCKSFRNLCFGKINRFNHDDFGWNYRITSMQASLGISQLERIDDIVKKKKEIGLEYYNQLKNIKSLYIPSPNLKGKDNIYWIIGILLNSNTKISAFELSKILKKKGIGTRPFFWPINKQNIFKNYKFAKKKFPNSEYLSKYGLYLPAALNINKKEIKYICNTIKEIIK